MHKNKSHNLRCSLFNVIRERRAYLWNTFVITNKLPKVLDNNNCNKFHILLYAYIFDAFCIAIIMHHTHLRVCLYNVK